MLNALFGEDKDVYIIDSERKYSTLAMSVGGNSIKIYSIWI